MATFHKTEQYCCHCDCDHTKKRYLKILAKTKFKCEKFESSDLSKSFSAINKMEKQCLLLVLSVCIICLPAITNGQAVTRDPRFYSREGDYNYKWPNPGDPEYR